jgi:hypothetical protein
MITEDNKFKFISGKIIDLGYLNLYYEVRCRKQKHITDLNHNEIIELSECDEAYMHCVGGGLERAQFHLTAGGGPILRFSWEEENWQSFSLYEQNLITEYKTWWSSEEYPEFLKRCKEVVVFQ